MRARSLSQPSRLSAWVHASHLAAAAIAAGVVALAPEGWTAVARLAAGILLGAIAGLILSLPLRAALGITAAALAELGRGQSIAPLPLDWQRRWGPLGGLLDRVDALGARERELAALRADLVRTTGQAAAQAERNRLARDLHDSIKQQLYAINVSAAAALARWESDVAGARRAVEDVRRAAQAALAEMAALLQQLRPAPLAAAGLLDALAEQCEALAHRTGARVTLDLGQPADAAAYATAVDTGRLTPGAEETIFRICQEALNNIARHARAGQATLRLRVEGEALRLQVTDDGQGFAPSQNGAPGYLAGRAETGYGLAGMRDRAEAIGATLDVRSAPGSGTHVELRVPLGEPAAAMRRMEAMSAEVKSSIQKVNVWQSVAMAATLLALVIAQGLVPRLTAQYQWGLALLFSGGLLLVCVIGGGIAWSRARAAAFAVTLTCGAESPTVRRMRRETAASRVWVALAAIVILPGALMPASWPQYPVAALAVGLACAVFAVVTLIQSLRATEGYWGRLDARTLSTEIDQAWGQRFSWAVVLLIVTLGYFGVYGGFQAAWVWPLSRDLVLDLLVTSFLGLLLVTALANYLQLRSWRSRVGDARAKAG